MSRTTLALCMVRLRATSYEPLNAALEVAFAPLGGTPLQWADELAPFAATAPSALTALSALLSAAKSLTEQSGVHFRAIVHLAEVDPEKLATDPQWALCEDALRTIADDTLAISEIVSLVTEPDQLDATWVEIGRMAPTDLRRPLKLFAVEHRSLPKVQSPVDRSVIGLPRLLTRFVGRDVEVREVLERFYLSRLVTVLGPARVGKTRLAMRVAEELLPSQVDGVAYVDLSPLSTPARLAEHVALGLHMDPLYGAPSMQSAQSYLAPREMTLVLDNCEHLVDGVAELVSQLTQKCPNVAVLAVSRAPLRLQGEASFRLPPLGIPAKGSRAQEVEDSEAVQLFLDRVQVANPDYVPDEQDLQTAAQVCRDLEGMPLAIELAAAHTSVYGVDGLPDLLRARTRPRTARIGRFDSVEEAIQWSVRLLSPTDRLVLQRLGAFAGSFDRAAAEAICSDGRVTPTEVSAAIERLVSASLLLRQTDTKGAERFRLLESTLHMCRRMLARHKGGAACRARHVSYYRAWLSERAGNFSSDPEAIRSIDVEYPNCRLALAYATETGASEDAVRMVTGLYYYWYLRNYNAEGADLAEAVVPLVPRGSPDRIRVLNATGSLCTISDPARARRTLELALRECEEYGHRVFSVGILSNLGMMLRHHATSEESIAILRQGFRLAQEPGEPIPTHLLRTLTLNLAASLCDVAHPDAEPLLNQLERDVTGDGETWTRANIQFDFGLLRYLQGRFTESSGRLSSALEGYLLLGDVRGASTSLAGLAASAACRELHHVAAQLAGAAAAFGERAIQTPRELSMFDRPRTLVATRNALGEGRFSEEYRRGRMMSTDDIMLFIRSV